MFLRGKGVAELKKVQHSLVLKFSCLKILAELQTSKELPIQQKIKEICIGTKFGWLVIIPFVIMLLGISKSSHLSPETISKVFG